MMNFTQTICPYCGTGCGMLLEEIDGKLCGTTPLKTSPVNQGMLCIKGWTAHEFVQSDKRLRNPLIKRNGVFDEVVMVLEAEICMILPAFFLRVLLLCRWRRIAGMIGNFHRSIAR